MYPILFTVGGVHFPSYYVLIAAAYLLAAYLSARLAHRQGQNPVDFIDFGLIGGLGGFVGARLFHALFSMPRFYLENPLALLKFWYGGFVLYGGMIIGVLAGIWLAHRRRVSVLLGADIVAGPMLLAVGVGRLGCFMAGCCYGKPTELGWPASVIFHVQHLPSGNFVPQASPLATPLFATQVFDSFLCISLFFLLLLWRPRKRFHGQLASTAIIGYSIGRFMIELLRNDLERGLYFNDCFSTSQIISVVVLIFGIGLWREGSRRIASSTH